ncbi:unnamed protein product [Tuber aestivum]|uniref:C2H2-type domain-containing protein n=1 Tax=Tuber aestivum TaxID=59557 RepID=A0A292PN49_9PEZI|nr:unnamed protein product [Tuber aestivum]
MYFETNTSPSLQLGQTSATEIAPPLPTELGPLPLYPLDDGFFSVLGPLPLSPSDGGFSVLGPSLNYTAIGYQANEPADDTPVPQWIAETSDTPRPTRDKFFCGSPRCSGNSGPHTCSSPSYTCEASGCTRRTPFKTRRSLNRHYEAEHLVERVDCPFPGCVNVGKKGIKRHDNLVAHMRNKHGWLPDGLCGNLLVGPRGRQRRSVEDPAL